MKKILEILQDGIYLLNVVTNYIFTILLVSSNINRGLQQSAKKFSHPPSFSTTRAYYPIIYLILSAHLYQYIFINSLYQLPLFAKP